MSNYRKPGPARIVISPERRRWLYRIALAVIALFGFYGLLTDEALALWGTLAAAVLSLPLADLNAKNGEPGDEDG